MLPGKVGRRPAERLSKVKALAVFSRRRSRPRARDVVVVLLPQYVPRNRIEQFLDNDNGRRIREALLGRPNVLVAEVPYRRAA